MTTELEEQLQKAIDLKNNGQLEEAYVILLKLVAEAPNCAPFVGILADVAYSRGLIAEAAKYFKKVTVLSPRSEMASLGLFHALFKLNDTDGAFDEMKRFMSIKHSDEYELLLSEITASLRENSSE